MNKVQKRKEYMKSYLKKYLKEKTTICDCGKDMKYSSLSKHRKSKGHIVKMAEIKLKKEIDIESMDDESNERKQRLNDIMESLKMI